MADTNFEWGDKGCVRDLNHPRHLKHAEDDGCEYCCMQCNTDTHWCPGCGTVSNHKEEPCDDACQITADTRSRY